MLLEFQKSQNVALRASEIFRILISELQKKSGASVSYFQSFRKI